MAKTLISGVGSVRAVGVYSASEISRLTDGLGGVGFRKQSPVKRGS